MGYDMSDKKYSKKLDLEKLKPYGDTMNDGKVQLSFTLPIMNDEKGDEAAKELAKISQLTASLAKMFNIKPNIAILSYSNFGASKTENSKKIAEAVGYIHRHFPNVVIDGEVQADFALNPDLLKKEFPFSKLVNKKVNVLIFPNLEASNITYKLLKELYKVDSIGPIMLGMEKAVHIFQLGASVEEMVNMIETQRAYEINSKAIAATDGMLRFLNNNL